MESNKYYIPDISEITIGYKCEVHFRKNEAVEDLVSLFLGDDNLKTDLDWQKCEWSVGDFSDYINRLILVRTKFLTKEDIESEGWAVDCFLLAGEEYERIKPFYSFIKGKWEIRWWGEPDYIVFYDHTYNYNNEVEGFSVYEGRCPSINEFRYIEKLLNSKHRKI